MRLRLSLLLLATACGTDSVDKQSAGITALYNPCGPDVAPEDCVSDSGLAEEAIRPTGQAASAELAAVQRSTGTHHLYLPAPACELELRSTGEATTSRNCPDCTLVLELNHRADSDPCGVGLLSYDTVIGLEPTGSDYIVWLGIYSDDWYASGTATVVGNTLTYSVGWDPYSTSYYGTTGTRYTFEGEHTLEW